MNVKSPSQCFERVSPDRGDAISMSTALPRTFICGLVRNAARPLKQTLDTISALEAICEGSFVFIVTNDNIDDTDVVLSAWKNSSADHDVLWLDGLEKAFPERIDRVAAARNFCLQHLRARHEGKFPLTIVMDLDGPNVNLDAGSTLEAVSSAGLQWDGIFANQRQAYYDIYALRHDQWCPEDCWEEVRRATTFPSLNRKVRVAIEKFVHSRQFKIRPEHSPIAVKSAFGGFAIYKTDAIKGAWYASRNRYSRLTCEHVLFNSLISEMGGKLFIIPSLLNDAPVEHLGPLSGTELPHELY